MFENNHISVIKDIAEIMHSIIEPERKIEIPKEMLSRQAGKDFGMQDYID